MPELGLSRSRKRALADLGLDSEATREALDASHAAVNRVSARENAAVVTAVETGGTAIIERVR